jgi:hypothetical protein
MTVSPGVLAAPRKVLTRDEWYARGRARREWHADQAGWQPPPNRPGPMILVDQPKGRVPDLVARRARTELRVQCCRAAHLLNFGMSAARCSVWSYRTEMAHYVTMRFLNVWYSRIDIDKVSRLYDAVQPTKAVRCRRIERNSDTLSEVRSVVLLLLGDREDEPQFLQLKEVQQSVLAAYADPSEYQHQGGRVARGQPMTHAPTGEFPSGPRASSGPTRTRGRDHHVRRLRDTALAHAGQNAKDDQCLTDAVANGRVRAVTGLSRADPQPPLTGPLLPRALRHRRARTGRALRAGRSCIPSRPAARGPRLTG